MVLNKTSNFWDRTLRNLRVAWKKIASGSEEFSEINLSPDLDYEDQCYLVGHMGACLEARGGEVSARKRAAELGHAYLSLNEVGRKKFLSVLTNEFGTSREKINQRINDLNAFNEEDSSWEAELRLRKSLVPARVQLLTQFNALPDGVKFLVDMRSELITWAKEDTTLKPLESDLKTLLTSWFDIDFLELKQITWNAPASLLEKFFVYEAVHEIKSWEDLKNRLAPDRRCFAYFHPRMPNEPLIFVWVALVNGIADNVQVLLDEKAPLGDPETCDSAIFYSISNAQIGLSGINFGNFLIKRVVDSLSKDLPNLRNFATLSPIPGFSRWLDQYLADGEFDLLTHENEKAIVKISSEDKPREALKDLISRHNWYIDDTVLSVLEEPLSRLCVHYLLNEKRRGGTAADSVAHFHLNNGARLEQLNWMADTSNRGLQQSKGIMLNYLYDLKLIEINHESYRAGEKIIVSPSIKKLQH